MDSKTLVLQYLDEAHATETALVTNLRAHITMATEKSYKRLLERHLKETQAQVENIDKRRKELGGEDDGRGIVAGVIGLARDAAGQALVLSKGPIDAVRTINQTERQLKNARDEAATEAIEIAVYDALEAIARAAGDTQTAKLAADHRKQEERMLADLRKEIGKLAVGLFEDRTDEKAKAKPAATTRRSPSGRSTSSGRSSSSSSSSRKKASTAKKSSSRSSGSRTRAGSKS